jgi:hypothetical protein
MCVRTPSGVNLAQEKRIIVYGHLGEPGDSPQHTLVQKCPWLQREQRAQFIPFHQATPASNEPNSWPGDNALPVRAFELHSFLRHDSIF